MSRTFLFLRNWSAVELRSYLPNGLGMVAIRKSWEQVADFSFPLAAVASAAAEVKCAASTPELCCNRNGMFWRVIIQAQPGKPIDRDPFVFAMKNTLLGAGFKQSKT